MSNSWLNSGGTMGGIGIESHHGDSGDGTELRLSTTSPRNGFPNDIEQHHHQADNNNNNHMMSPLARASAASAAMASSSSLSASSASRRKHSSHHQHDAAAVDHHHHHTHSQYDQEQQQQQQSSSPSLPQHHQHQHVQYRSPLTSPSASSSTSRRLAKTKSLSTSDDDYDEDGESMTLSSSSFCTKRRIIVSVVLLAIVGAAVGVSMALTGGGSGGGSGAGGGNNNNNNVGGDDASSSFVSVPGGPPTSSPAPTPSNANEIGDIIDTTLARFGGSEFENPNSYQSFAKRWVMAHEYPIQDGSTLSTQQQVTQLYAVACIYYNTYSVQSDWTDFHYGPDVSTIPGWFSSLGWMEDPANVCNWYGLTCNENGQISKIELDTNGLTGYFPPEVALLHESLQTIDLYNNILHNSGELGNSFLGELTNLEFLFFGTTSFEYDGVPTHLGRLTKLQELDFSYTLYFGDLPGEIFANMPDLKYLVMDGNAYNTTLPSELVQLPSLEYLYAGFSFLQGDLNFVADMPKIYELWLDDNPGIGGPIPPSVGLATNLASLSITNCGLTGTVPPEIGDLTNMIQLWMYDNQLTGTIPTELGNLITMKILNLQKNELVGEMPPNVCSRRRPFGRLEELEADCDGAISCTEECCTCCGAECIDL